MKEETLPPPQLGSAGSPRLARGLNLRSCNAKRHPNDGPDGEVTTFCWILGNSAMSAILEWYEEAAVYEDGWRRLLTPAAVSPAPGWGRRSPTLGLQDFLDGVAEVALRASDGDREAALRLSRRAWAAAAKRAGTIGVPTPQVVCERLGLGWARVLELALTEEARRPSVAAHWDGSLGRPLGAEGPDLALRALRSVAHQLGAIPTMDEYDAEVVRLERAKSKGKLITPVRYPRADFLSSQFGGWDRALIAAGLADTPTRRRRSTPALLDTLDVCVEETGVIPTFGYFRKWARLKGIPLPTEKGWLEITYQYRRQRSERGLPTVSRTTRFASCPPLPAPSTCRLRRPFRVTKEQAMESLRRYKAVHHDGRAHITQKSYLVACREDPDLIWPSSLARLGRFHDLCHEAGIE
jgi:hypothetical protein